MVGRVGGERSLVRVTHPEWVGPRIGSWSITGVAWLLLASLAAGLFLHPLQFAMTQVLEGYWGYSRAARVLLRIRIRHHRNRLQKTQNLLTWIDDRLEQRINTELKRLRRSDPASLAGKTVEQQQRIILHTEYGNDLGGLLAAGEAAEHATNRYPEMDRIMPTRLGNALRREEDRAGQQYGINAITTAPHFALVSPDKHVQYVRDTRQQMDTSVRLCVVSLLGAVETFACLLTDGWWLLIALVPYSLAYLAYRAAAAAADDYTTAVKTVIDLNRFALYESLHIELPRNSVEERWNNKKVMGLLDQERKAGVRYKHPAAGTPSTGAASATPPGTP